MAVSALIVTLLGLAAAEDTLTPKNIDISLTARWPETPIAAEAAEFLAVEGSQLFWTFAETYVPPEGGSDEAHLAAVELAAAKLLSPLGLKLLRGYLAAHIFSARVEMFRQLQTREEQEHGMDSADGWVRACGRVQALSASEPAPALVDAVLAGGCSVPESLEERETAEVTPLAVDHVFGSVGGGTAPMVVLYAPLGSAAFRAAHATLTQRAREGAIVYVYRPQVRAAPGARSQSLQGYGVQLAIKNMEYKVLDDKAVQDLGGIEGDDDEAAEGEAEDEADVGGFFFGTLASRRPELAAQLQALQGTLLAQETEASTKLKAWAMQDLGLQAATRVLAASDPLKALRDVCQNFPFASGKLSKLKVSQELSAGVRASQQTYFGPGYNGAFLNGLALPITDNDFYGLMNTIQSELHTIDALSSLELPAATISRLVSLPPPQASLRINPSHEAVLFINDVVKDKKYQQFDPQLRAMTRVNMWGQMAFCRQNVLTMIFVVDPSSELGLAVLAYMLGLYANGAPIRFGLVLAPAASARGAVVGTDPKSDAFLPAATDGAPRTRLRALASTYETAEWAADPIATALEAAAASAGGADAKGGSGGGTGGEGKAGGALAAAEGGESPEGGGAVAAAEGGASPDAPSDEAQRLGLLLTKLFLFLKKKAGTQASLKFLSAVNENRMQMMMGFFGGGGYDELEEHHLAKAFEQAYPRKLGEQLDRLTVYQGIVQGTITDFDELAAGGARFLRDKGLGAAPAILTNGVLTPVTQNYEQEVMMALNAEHRFVSSLISKRVLTDETTDKAAAIIKAGLAFPRYSKALLLPIDDIEVAPLTPAAALASVAWLASIAAPKDEAAPAEAAPKDGAAVAETESMAAADDEFGDEQMFGAGEEEGGAGADADAGAIDPALLHSVSHLLVIDLCQPAHLSVLAGTLSALEASPNGRSRLGLLHNPTAASHEACAPAAAAAWTALVRAFDGSTYAPLKALVALLHAASLAPGASSISSALASAVLPAKAHGGPAVDLGAHAAYAATLGLGAGAGALITNGRLVLLTGGAPLDAVDVALLEEYELRQRAEGAAHLISQLTVSHDKDASVEGGAARWRSDVLMHAVVQLTSVAKRALARDAGKDRKVQLQPDDLPCGAACVRIPGEGVGAAMELVAILDPLSKAAQRLAPLMMELHVALGCTVTLHLNPDTAITEFPLEDFYRYVVSLTPKFDADGRSLAPTADMARFARLKTPQVLTLHLDAPEAWLVQVNEAAYDMDNLRLAELGERRTLYARYELVSVLITGSCQDFRKHEPPNGLQLLLGTSPAAPHSTDTLVMSNLGYWQLKAMPGAWLLSLAPGPSSEVFSIHSDAKLVAAGHATALLGGRGHIDVAGLQPRRAIRLLVSDFTGLHATLLVSKKVGMESVSILDSEDKQGGGAGGGGGGGGGGSGDKSGVLDSLSKWAFGSAGSAADDDVVNVFSLASGHLYERFLKIMMQSVVDRTTRKVKFWLLKNFLSPAFMGFLPHMAKEVGFEYELVQYQWPTWLHKQTNKQRIIWGYKILFLDVMFPLHLKRIIYIDADQVINADVGELWDLKMPPRTAVAMTPFCNRDANPDTTGFRFFAHGYWKDHLRGHPYHISALFVVDLHKFRRRAYGDQYRIFYDSLSKDPNSLANLDQDLPNYAQHVVPIHSLPEEWLWCETWCGNASKPAAKTVDLCNNPLTKEPKLNQAHRIVGKRWSTYDERSNEIERSLSAAARAHDAASDGAAKPRDEL